MTFAVRHSGHLCVAADIQRTVLVPRQKATTKGPGADVGHIVVQIGAEMTGERQATRFVRSMRSPATLRCSLGVVQRAGRNCGRE